MLKPDFTIIPGRPGIYFFRKKTGKVLYVGKALSLHDRLKSYFQTDVPVKVGNMVAQADSLDFIETGSEFEALILEVVNIKKYRPKFNVIFKDDKSYLYAFISTSEDYPKIILTRKPGIDLNDKIAQPGDYAGKKGVFVGPFTSSLILRRLLKSLRRIFPFCQQRLNKRPCFYSQLGLCRPCPGYIAKLPLSEKQALTKKYRQNIFLLLRVLEGKIKQVENLLKKEMQQLALKSNFEAAADIRDQLQYLFKLKNSTRISAFLENPNYYQQQQQDACEMLKTVLLPYFPGLSKLERIECYDISNIQGYLAYGSQTVYINGIPEKSHYRSYGISSTLPNDIAMLREMLERRFKHKEWTLPDLIIVDGGKGQVGMVKELLGQSGLPIPVIGLAKRFEEIIICQDGNFISFRLSRHQPALKLIQAIRDEAHRFALKAYQHKHRRKLIHLREIPRSLDRGM